MSDYDTRDRNPARNDDDDSPEPRPRRRRSWQEPEPPPSRAKSYVAFLVLGLVVGGLGLWLATGVLGIKRGTDPNAHLRDPAPAVPLDTEEQEGVTLFESVKDSVVNVDVVMVKQGKWDQQSETATSGGSGFI